MGLPGRRQSGLLATLPNFFASMRWQHLLRYAVFAVVVSICLSGILLFRQPEGGILSKAKDIHYFDYIWSEKPEVDENGVPIRHPIEELIEDSRTTHESLLSERSRSLAAAAAAYRARRGRHPPPGFGAWFQYAQDHDAVIVEKFFDRIYHDISPYWGLDPNTTAERASGWHHVVRVRNGVANATGNTEGRVPWLRLWTDLVSEAAAHLPDVDMPINYMDESRLLVPWEDIDRYVTKEHSQRSLVSTDKVVKQYSGLAHVDAKSNLTQPYDPEWLRGNYWDLARAACAPASPSRDVKPLESFEQQPVVAADWDPEYSHKGYVRNMTGATDPCLQPHLRGMHGTFVEPLTMSTSKELIPLFGGCKLPNNNEILIPGAMYLTDDPFYSGGETHGPPWSQKRDGVVWRGVASGGRNKAENWFRMQRHRLLEMLNSTTVETMESSHTRAPSFEFPPIEKYDFPRRREGKIGSWLEWFSNVGFVNLLCFPADSECAYVLPHLREVESMPMSEQYKFKFMPDVDGNSFSARFRGFMLSTSLPIKATIYAEWHDDRLMPWQHYVPMDNTFQELYGILDFFTRNRKGDQAARLIAETGMDWATKVLRREDMLLYVWRLLLEFARVCDTKREVLGFVDDLKLAT